MSELRSQQKILIKRRNELMECWFLRFRKKKKVELEKIECLLDDLELKRYNNSTYKTEIDILIHECNNFIDKIKRYKHE